MSSNNQFYGGNQVSSYSFQNAPATVMTNLAVNFLKRHYIFSFLWIFGLLLTAFANGYSVDSETDREFSKKLYDADKIEQTQLRDAYLDNDAAYRRYYQSKGWFSCDVGCQHNYQKYLDAQQRLREAKAIHNAALSEARKVVGIWSEYGVSDTRRLFWSSWEWGKNFAKRISFYDAIFLAFDSRNDSFWAYVLQMVIRVLMNFTIGFFSALISFIWQLFWFVRTYSTGISGFLYWLLGSIAAFSMIVSAIGAMYGTAIGVVAVAVNMAGPALQGPQRRQRVHYHRY